MNIFQPLVSDQFTIAILLDLLPMELVAGLVSFATSIFILLAIRIVDKDAAAVGLSPERQHATFQLSDGRFQPLSDAGEHFGDMLKSAAAGMSDAISALETHGTAFRYEFQSPDGRAYDVSGWPSGGTALVKVSELDANKVNLPAPKTAASAENDQGELAQKVLENVPFLAWQENRDGTLDWANTPYHTLIDDGDSDGTVAKALLVPASDDPDQPAVRVQIRGRNQDCWLDVSRQAISPDETIGIAVDVTPQIEAEASLSRFVETLTGTFAHLPIGLAIFDHDRRLGMFNPALGELLKLDPAWLAGQPTLREFLESLRENRQMPDQKDFVSWRRQLTALEECAANGDYSETWILPSGQTFRVVGRPHPQGALAFLFEDISGTVQLEERRRTELALNQTLMNRLSEAIAVFDTSGRLSFANKAFTNLWGSDAPDAGSRPGIAAMVTYWQRQSRETTIWAELKTYASGATERACWSARIQLLDGPELDCRFAPLPDGSTLTVFQTGAAHSAGNMEDTLTMDDDLEPRRFFAGLEDILLPRDVRLITENWNNAPALPGPTHDLRRIAWNMILAVLEFAPDAKVVSISRVGERGSVTITASPQSEGRSGQGADEPGGIAFRVLQQFVDRNRGTLAVNKQTSRQAFSLSCVIQLQDALAVPPDSVPGRASGSASPG